MNQPISYIKKPELFPKFQCGQCNELHDEFEDAAECCCEVKEVYQCPICLKVHKGFAAEKQALDCCGFDPENPVEIKPTAEELEKHGQLRIEGL